MFFHCLLSWFVSFRFLCACTRLRVLEGLLGTPRMVFDSKSNVIGSFRTIVFQVFLIWKVIREKSWKNGITFGTTNFGKIDFVYFITIQRGKMLRLVIFTEYIQITLSVTYTRHVNLTFQFFLNLFELQFINNWIFKLHSNF